MNFDELLKNAAMQKATITFASGYAKRMMEAQYTRMMDTNFGKRTSCLTTPSKYAVEAVLNVVVAYLATKENTIANTPIKQFLWEVAKDAPSEISKRLLNGKPSTPPDPGTIGIEGSSDEKRTVLDGLLRMDAKDLSVFVAWLENASPEDRRQMAEAVSKMTEEEQQKLLAMTAEQVRTLFSSASNSQSESPKSEGMIGSLTSAMRGLNERLEERKRPS